MRPFRNYRYHGAFFVAIVLIVALFGALIWENYSISRQQALVTARNIMTVVRSIVDANLSRAEGDLYAFAHQVTAEDMSGPVSSARREDLERGMRLHLTNFPGVINYRIVNADGVSIISSGSVNANVVINVADREWFQTLKNDASRSVTISDVVMGRAVGEHTVILAVPIRDATGGFMGASIAVLNLQYLQSLVDDLDVGDNALIIIRRMDNFKQIIRRPRMQNPETEAILGAELSRQLVGSVEAGEGDFVSMVDPIPRRYSYRYLPHYRINVFVSVAEKDYLAPWRKQSQWLAEIVLFLISGLIFLYVAQIRAQTKLQHFNTQLVASEKRLSEETAQLQSILRTASDGIHILNASGNLVMASDSFYAMHGFTAETALGRHVTSWNVQWSGESFDQFLERLMRLETIEHFETKHQRSDGTVFDAEIYTRGLLLGDEPFLYCSARDISARKSAEFRLKESEERYRNLIENTTDWIWETDADHRLTMISQSFDARFGQSSLPMIGMLYWEVVADCQAESLNWQALRHSLLNCESFRDIRYWIVGIKGMRVCISISGAPVYDGLGVFLGFRGHGSDVSVEARAMEKLKMANAELEQFSYVVSHDLRQPLRMVSSYMSLIKHKLWDSLDDEVKGFFTFAIDGAKRMDQLILDLLEYSRAGKDVDVSPLNMQTIISDCLNNLRVAIDESKAEVVVSDAMPTIFGSKVEVTQLFQNLIGNAIKYHVPDRIPKVTVSCRDEAGQWVFAIEDNGIGIEETSRERVFQVFQRLVAKDKYEGTGIGLAICKKVVDRLGGRIWIDSTLGQGTTFFVSLPKVVD